MDASDSGNSVQPLEESTESTSTYMLKPTPKVFQCRKPLLEELYEKGHLPMYHFIPIAIVALSVATTILYFFVFDEHEKHFEFLISYMKSEYDNLHITIGLNFIISYASILISFYGFSFWKFLRTLVKNKSYVDNAALVLCAMFYSLIFVLPFRCIDIHQMPFSSKFLFAVIQVHIFMKVHAYIRENIPNVLYYDKMVKDHGESNCWQPNFNNYFYFFSAPTYVYRDSYPRTKNVDWGKFLQYSFGVHCSMLIPLIPIALIIVAELCKCQSQPVSLLESVGRTILILALSAYVEFVMAPYGMFHCAFNAWAEVVQFGDRMFYVEWWNFRSNFEVARKWTFVLHEWLHYYVFLDCRNVLRLSKRNSAIITYLVTALNHDYVLAIAFEFTLPMLCCGVLIYLILLPKTFERKHTASHKAKSNSKFRVFIGFASYYFIIVFLYHLVLCRKMKCSQTREASWTDMLFFSVSQC